MKNLKNLKVISIKQCEMELAKEHMLQGEVGTHPNQPVLQMDRVKKIVSASTEENEVAAEDMGSTPIILRYG
jgi:hypothetical protein